MADKSAKLNIESHPPIPLSISIPTLGKPVIDISKLGNDGYFTFDPGFMSTASCESQITYIDGDAGILLYRGYPIDQLASQKDFLDVCYLLLNGELPTPNEKQTFQQKLSFHAQVDPQIQQVFHGFGPSAHPMAMMIGAFSALAGFYHETINLKKVEDRYQATLQMIAKVTSLAAMSFKHGKGEIFVNPNPELGYAENFLNMMFGAQGQKPNPVLSQAMDIIFTLHADHEQNASTSTVRLAGSTGTDPFASICAGISALWGPAHGGANEACLEMLKEIGDIKNIPQYLKRAKDKNDPFRLMGFGHRVYKNYDPRAKVMRKTCHQVLDAMGAHNIPLFKLAVELERIALEDSYFVERKLYPNIDFYSGITLSAMGIPSNMFTVIFALARTVGWASHWLEMTASAYKIGRPRQLYTGHTQRNLP